MMLGFNGLTGMSVSQALIKAFTEERSRFYRISSFIPFCLEVGKGASWLGTPTLSGCLHLPCRTPLVSKGLGPFITPTTYYKSHLARELDSAVWVSPPQAVTPAPLHSPRGKQPLQTQHSHVKHASGLRKEEIKH